MANHLSDLKPDTRNARKHSPRNLGQIERSIQTNGFGRSLLLANDGTIIAGNATADAAGSIGMENVQIVESDGTRVIAVKRTDVEPGSSRFHELALADNRSAELAEWDVDVLASLQDDIDLSQFFVDDEIAALLDSLNPPVGLTDPDDVPAVPDEPVTKPGDLWLLGRHRLLCSDSTDLLQLERLLDGLTPDLLHTDPPYGIGIVSVKGLAASDLTGGSKPFGSVNNANRKNPTVEARGVTNGVKSKPSAVEDRARGSVQRGPTSKIIQANTYPVMHGDQEPFDPGYLLTLAPIIVLWGANYFAEKLPVSSSWICWDKREGITRNSFADCELAWSSHGGPARVFHHLWNGLHKGSQHGERRTHPTEKPVALFEEIGNLYAPQKLWLDLYAGSGAQLIAAERTGATCYACEIEPEYVDVIVQRFERHTGQTATLAPALHETAAD